MFRRIPGFDTLAVHAGAQADPATGGRTTSISRAAPYMFGDANEHAGLLEERMAALEGGTAAVATASGHAALLLIFHILMKPGDNVVAANKFHGGSNYQFSHALQNFGWQVRWSDSEIIDSFETAIDGNTRAIFIESLANPGGVFIDIEKIAAIAQRHGLPLIVDNTMASPYLLRPVEYGADIIVHSLNHFIEGHGNVGGGLIVDCGTFDWSKSGHYPLLSQPRPDYGGKILHDTYGNQAFAIACRVSGLRDLGLPLSSFSALFLASELETLSLRMQRHCDNALAVAGWLREHDKVAWVSYPGLSEDPNHALQQKYSPKGAGGFLTLGLKGGDAADRQMVEAIEIFSHVANVRGTKSGIIHPASAAHHQLGEELKLAAGAGPEGLCLSIGIEDVADIIADLQQALAKI